MATRASSCKSPDCFCSAPRLPLPCLAPSNETPNEPAASFLSFPARSAACVVSPLVSPAFPPHVFVCPPPALPADFSIHPLLHSVSLFLSLSSSHASVVLLSLFSPVWSLWSCSWLPPSFTYVEGRDVANLWLMRPEVLLGFSSLLQRLGPFEESSNLCWVVFFHF